MLLSDYGFSAALSFLVAAMVWILCCVPIEIMYLSGLVQDFPIWRWPLWISAGVGVTLFCVMIVLQRCFEES